MRFISKLLMVVCLLGVAYGQTMGPNTGATSFGASDDHGVDSINLATLVPTFNFPAISKPGAIPLGLSIVSPQVCWINPLGPNWTCGKGLLADFKASVGNSLLMSTSYYLGGSGACANKISEVNGLVDSGGTFHAVPLTPVAYAPCGSGATVTTTDGSHISATIGSGGGVTNISLPNGFTSPGLAGEAGTATVAVDTFGNSLSRTYITNPCCSYTYNETLGTSTITSSPGSYGYVDSNGSAQNITFTAGAQTTFKSYYGGQCGTSTGTSPVTPVAAINYPDGTHTG